MMMAEGRSTRLDREVQKQILEHLAEVHPDYGSMLDPLFNSSKDQEVERYNTYYLVGHGLLIFSSMA
jgi:hypothetical protein